MADNKKEIIIKGVPASAGIAIGKVFLLEDDDFYIIQRELPTHARARELERFKAAVDKTRRGLHNVYGKINEILGENYAKIADVHLLILEDHALKGEIERLVQNGMNAEFAVLKTINKISATFDAIEDEYFRERKQDIQDVGKKIISNLLGKHDRSLSNITEESIVVAHNLTPADTVTIREVMVRGFATDIGGKTSHTAIVAQGLEIPAVVGLKNISSRVSNGDIIVIDGNKGEVILNPSDEILAKYKEEAVIQSKKTKDLEKLKDLPAEKLDGHRVSILGNIDNCNEIKSVLNNGACGVGLYRTEFMYFNRNTEGTDIHQLTTYVFIQ